MNLLVFLAIICIASAVQLNDTICRTEDCNKTATLISTSRNNSVNPCDDYYQYSCGNWIKEHPADENDMSGVNNFVQLEKDEIQKLIKLLNQSSTKKDDKLFHPLINLYKGCVDSKKRESNKKRDFGLINDIIKQTIGGWPLIDTNWKESDFDLEKAIIESIKVTFTSSFLNIRVMNDLKDNNKTIITMTSNSFPAYGLTGIIGIPEQKKKELRTKDEYYASLTEGEKYATKHVSEALKGSALNESLLLKDMNDVKNVWLPSSTIGNADYLLANYEDFKYNVKNLSSIKGLNFRRILDEVMKSENITVGDNDSILADMDYLTHLAPYLQTHEKRVIANKMAFDLVMSLIGFTTTNMTVMAQIWDGLGGLVDVPQFCALHAIKDLPDLLGRYYYDKQFDKQSIKDMKELIDQLREAFHQILEENQWMDTTTRERAIKKLNAITDNIGFPDIVYNLTKLQEFHKQFVNFSENTFLANMLKVLSHKKSIGLRQLRDKNLMKGHWEWPANPAIVNAFYNPEDNGIYFPAAIAQLPFFSHTRPRSVNFASIGMIIGHELTHAFDNKGSRFDEKGNLNQWITKISQKTFDTKGQCFVQQYNNISYKLKQDKNAKNVSGRNTLGENLGDHGGIRIAFKAMQLYKSKHGGKLPKLGEPLSNFSDEKLFFSSFANMWCSHKSDEALGWQLIADPHSPEDARVRATLANFPEFAKEYNCPVGSRMNPKNKCVLWL